MRIPGQHLRRGTMVQLAVEEWMSQAGEVQVTWEWSRMAVGCHCETGVVSLRE